MGTKIGMTRIFDTKGLEIPVTVVKVERCWVVGKKTPERDGYTALQLGYGAKKPYKATKPFAGLFKNIGDGTIASRIQEVRIRDTKENLDHYELGKEIRADIFAAGDYVDVVGISLGKGFAGVMKRHGFGGLPASHGHSEYRRAPGSMSASSYPSRVFKGKKLPGRMGSDRVTIQKLEVVNVNADENMILLRGAVPGRRGGVITIKETVKAKKRTKG